MLPDPPFTTIRGPAHRGERAPDRPRQRVINSCQARSGAGPRRSPPLVAGTAGPAFAAATHQAITPPGVTADEFAELTVEVAELRAEVGRLRELGKYLESRLEQLEKVSRMPQ